VTTFPAASGVEPIFDSRGPLVDLEADAVPQAVPEVLGVSRVVDDRAGDRVDVAALGPGPDGGERRLLRAQHEVVDLPVARVELARGDRPGAVRGVAVEVGAPVDDDERPGRDRLPAGLGVRERAVRAGGDDGRERHPLGAAPAHRDLEVERDVALRASDEAAVDDLGERRVGQPGGGPDRVELGGVLQRAQVLDEPAGGDEVDAEAGELRVLADRDLGVVEADAPGRQPVRRPLEQVLADLVRVRVAHLVARLREVAEVGQEPAGAVAADDGRPARAGEAGQPPHVRGARDEQGVELALGEDGGDAVGALGGGGHAVSRSATRASR
jgi:hypothetical protein